MKPKTKTKNLTRAQIIKRATKMYEKGKHPDIMVFDDDGDPPYGTVSYTDDGLGAWVSAAVWVSLADPPRRYNGRRYS